MATAVRMWTNVWPIMAAAPPLPWFNAWTPWAPSTVVPALQVWGEKKRVKKFNYSSGWPAGTYVMCMHRPYNNKVTVCVTLVTQVTWLPDWYVIPGRLIPSRSKGICTQRASVAEWRCRQRCHRMRDNHLNPVEVGKGAGWSPTDVTQWKTLQSRVGFCAKTAKLIGWFICKAESLLGRNEGLGHEVTPDPSEFQCKHSPATDEGWSSLTCFLDTIARRKQSFQTATSGQPGPGVQMVVKIKPLGQ